jgi:HEPN domain-containing protein
MVVETEWKKRAINELEQATAARENGNEGMARVCARRAAGLIIGEYLQRQQIPSPGPSAYDRLRMLLDLADVPEQARQISEHLLKRVNEDFNLPFEADLIEETRRLAKQLLSERL